TIANAVNLFLNHGILYPAAPGITPDRELKLRTVLERASRDIEGRFPDQPLVEARIRLTLGNAFQALGEYAAAERHALRAVELYRRHLGPESREALGASNDLAIIYRVQQRLGDARKLFEQTLEAQRRTLGLEDRDTLISMANLAELFHTQGKLDDA